MNVKEAWINIKGTLFSYFTVGIVKIKDKETVPGTLDGILEFRNENTDVLAKISIAEPSANENATTKYYVDQAIAGIDPDSTGTIKNIRFALTFAASQDSVVLLPANARVKTITVEVTTPYSNGTTIEVGTTADPNLILESDIVTRMAKVGFYIINEDTQWAATAETVKVALGGTPSAGAGFMNVIYTIV
jgi:hypothetical protein